MNVKRIVKYIKEELERGDKIQYQGPNRHYPEYYEAKLSFAAEKAYFSGLEDLLEWIERDGKEPERAPYVPPGPTWKDKVKQMQEGKTRQDHIEAARRNTRWTGLDSIKQF